MADTPTAPDRPSAVTLHDQLLTAVSERGRIATEDLNGDWWEMVIAYCQRDVAVLARHMPCSGTLHHYHVGSPTRAACHRCGDHWPCDETRAVAGLYGVELPDA